MKLVRIKNVIKLHSSILIILLFCSCVNKSDEKKTTVFYTSKPTKVVNTVYDTHSLPAIASTDSKTINGKPINDNFVKKLLPEYPNAVIFRPEFARVLNDTYIETFSSLQHMKDWKISFSNVDDFNQNGKRDVAIIGLTDLNPTNNIYTIFMIIAEEIKPDYFSITFKLFHNLQRQTSKDGKFRPYQFLYTRTFSSKEVSPVRKPQSQINSQEIINFPYSEYFEMPADVPYILFTYTINTGLSNPEKLFLKWNGKSYLRILIGDDEI